MCLSLSLYCGHSHCRFFCALVRNAAELVSIPSSPQNFKQQVLNPVTQNSNKTLGLSHLSLCVWKHLALVTFVSPRVTYQQHCDYNSVPFLHWVAYHRAQIRPEPTWGGEQRFFKKFRQYNLVSSVVVKSKDIA